MQCTFVAEENLVSLQVVPPQYGDTTNHDKLVPTNTVMVIDISGSMNGAATVTNDDGDKINHGWNLLDIVKHASNTISRILCENDRLSIVTFSDDAALLMDWTYCKEDNKSMIQDIIMSMKPFRTTNYTAGLTLGLQQIEKLQMNEQNSQLYNLIFFTDGQPSAEYNPGRGYVHLCDMLQSKMKTKVHMTAIGLGNNLDSKLLANIAPFGFIYLPDPGCIGNSMCNLVSHSKTIVLHESSVFSNAFIRVYPASALISSVAYNIVKSTAEFVDVSIGPIIYDIPRTFILEASNYSHIELVQQGWQNQYIQRFTQSEGSILRSEVMRSNVVQTLNRIHLPIDTTFLESYVNQMDTSDDLFKTMTEEMLPGLVNHYHTWGRHFLISLPPMLRDQRRSNFRDKCLQSFYTAKDGSDSMFEIICNAAEAVFATTLPPQPSLLTTPNQPASIAHVLPDEFLRGGGCWHGNGKVYLNVNNVMIPTPTHMIKANDLVFTYDHAYTRVVCVVKRNMKNVKLAQIGNLMITEWHPVFLKNSWVFPRDVALHTCSENMPVYNFVLEDSHIVLVDDVACVTLGHNFDMPVVRHDFYGTNKIIQYLKTHPGWNHGYIELDDQ